jgi:hypothetical protein
MKPKERSQEMNWQRGLFRTWVFTTALWLIVFGGSSFWRWYEDPWRVVSINPITHTHTTPVGPDELVLPDPSHSGKMVPCSDLPERLATGCGRASPTPDADYSPWWASLEAPALITFGPPVALLVVGIGVFWALRGYKS